MKIAVGGFAQESHSFSPVPGSWAHFGPQELLRGQAAFRAAYAPIAAEILIVDATGVASPNLRTLPFRHVRRPLYPLDQ